MAQRAPDPFLTYSQQGWTDTDRNLWYNSSQGSRLMPMAWMRALERHQDQVLFLAAENIERYRYLPYTTPSGNTLPVGFAEDVQSDQRLDFTKLRWLPNQSDREPWIGFTCAACHTNEVALGERRLRVDGAPGMGDFQSFVEQLDRSLATTRSDQAKWARFAQRVLGTHNNDRNRRRLAGAVDQLLAYRGQVARMNATDMRYGFSRLDAFGHIFNQVSLFTRAGTPISNPPTAPVSYPFLWNVPQHDRVQWNGSVPNRRIQLRDGYLDIGAVGRNTGEVIGVFGEVVTHRHKILGLLDPFRSSVRVRQLIGLETMLERLQPPAWPAEMLGRIDQAAAARGRGLFTRHCASCHQPLDRTDLTTRFNAQMSWFPRNAPAHTIVPTTPGGPTTRPNISPGTDPVMACNAYYAAAASGNLRGYKSGQFPIGVIAPVLDLTGVTVLYTLAGEARELIGSAIKIYEGGTVRPEVDGTSRSRRVRRAGRREAAVPAPAAQPPGPAATTPATGPLPSDAYPGLPRFYQGCVNKNWGGAEDVILGYKARPLTGIWSTAPYLHNGSVPNLYELLLPPDRRSNSFWVGTRQFDPQRVGYVTTPSNENSFLFRTRDDSAAVIWGNWNGGHDYGNDRLSERERMDLVEYLKTL
jgi:mono/diheme cytochrome c family protein